MCVFRSKRGMQQKRRKKIRIIWNKEWWLIDWRRLPSCGSEWIDRKLQGCASLCLPLPKTSFFVNISLQQVSFRFLHYTIATPYFFFFTKYPCFQINFYKLLDCWPVCRTDLLLRDWHMNNKMKYIISNSEKKNRW